MPLTEKGQEILADMRKEYGSSKGESVFYASKNAGTISGVDQQPGEPGHEAAEVNLIHGLERLHTGGADQSYPPVPPTAIEGMPSQPADADPMAGCDPSMRFDGRHSYENDANSKMGGLPQTVSHAAMRGWKAF